METMKKTANQNCPIARAALLLSDAWTMLILRDLGRKPMRFNELLDSLKTISTRTLTLKLKRLETLGMVRKRDAHHYALTPGGAKIKPVLKAMERCGKYFSRISAG